MKLLSMQLSPVFRYFVRLRSKCLSQHHVLEHSHSLPLMREAKFYTHINDRQNYTSVYFNLCVCLEDKQHGIRFWTKW